MKSLHATTAVLELGAGLALLGFPSLTTMVLNNTSDSTEGCSITYLLSTELVLNFIRDKE
jgi:hypothetical protein